MWWIYFEQPAHGRSTSLRASMRWGHSHFVVFASAAATDAGRAVAVAHDLHVAYVGDLVHAAADPPHRARHGRADRAAGDRAPNRGLCIRPSTIRSRKVTTVAPVC